MTATEIPPPRVVARPLRVALVDNEELIHEAVAARLAAAPDRFALVATAFDVNGVKRFDLGGIDVVIADLYLEGALNATPPTWEYIRYLDEHDVPVLVYSSSDRDDDVYDATRRFRVGFLHKTSSTREDLYDMVEMVAEGNWERAVDARWGMSLREVHRRRHELQELLTDKQLETLKLLARGWAYKQIAKKMGISVHGVHSHMKSLRLRLLGGSGTKAEVTNEALRRGLLSPEDLQDED